MIIKKADAMSATIIGSVTNRPVKMKLFDTATQKRGSPNSALKLSRPTKRGVPRPFQSVRESRMVAMTGNATTDALRIRAGRTKSQAESRSLSNRSVSGVAAMGAFVAFIFKPAFKN